MLLLEEAAKLRCPPSDVLSKVQINKQDNNGGSRRGECQGQSALEVVAKERITKDNLKDSNLKEEAFNRTAEAKSHVSLDIPWTCGKWEREDSI